MSGFSMNKSAKDNIAAMDRRAKTTVTPAAAPIPPPPAVIYTPEDIARMKAKAAASATMGANNAISAGASRFGVTNPAFGLLAERARSGAGVDAQQGGAAAELMARNANAGYQQDQERLNQSGGYLDIARNNAANADRLADVQFPAQAAQASATIRDLIPQPQAPQGGLSFGNNVGQDGIDRSSPGAAYTSILRRRMKQTGTPAVA